MVGGSKRHGAAARWRERLNRWERSGLTITEFCRRERVSLPSFFSWRKRLAAESASTPQGRLGSGPRFIPVEVVDGPPMTPASVPRLGIGSTWPAVEVVLPRGVTVKVGTHVDEQHLRQILRAVVAETAGC